MESTMLYIPGTTLSFIIDKKYKETHEWRDKITDSMDLKLESKLYCGVSNWAIYSLNFQ